MNNMQTLMLVNILMGQLEIQELTIETLYKEREKLEKELSKSKKK